MTLPSFGPHLAVFGTGSDVGKSLLAAAFCRLLRQAGVNVAPFKAQNMSNNAYVTADGGEIGRAQYVQAVAAGVSPSVHHNPVLLKPSADNRSQVIVHGRVLGNSDARSYFAGTSPLAQAALESLQHLQAQHESLVIEGAGSCAEVNLRAREFVNFPMAHAACASVILVADIDRGGVFGQVVGSLEVMPPLDRARVRGILINKFRGDISLFDDGVRYLEERTQLPVLGVVPYLYGLDLDAEDAFSMNHTVDPLRPAADGKLPIAVIKLPHIANFTDFDALAREPGVALEYLYRPRSLQGYAGVILPGTKNVIGDRNWLSATGWDPHLTSYAASGGHLFGICGGFQLLGRELQDPLGAESAQRFAHGLGILNVDTVLAHDKIVRQVHGYSCTERTPVRGYEIHLGRTTTDGYEPLFELRLGAEDDAAAARQLDGVRGEKVWATYLHGIFDGAPFRQMFLRWLAPHYEPPAIQSTPESRLDRELERFAHHVAEHVAWQRVLGWLQGAKNAKP